MTADLREKPNDRFHFDGDELVCPAGHRTPFPRDTFIPDTEYEPWIRDHLMCEPPTPA